MNFRPISIPTPNLSKKKISQIQRKNESKDKENLEHTIKILGKRREEAERDGDRKKKFASIAYERDQKDRYNIRNRLRKLKQDYKNAKKTIPKEDFDILKNFSELKDPNYWKKAKEKGEYSDQDIAFYYRDLWDISPKNVVKFRN